MKHNSILARQSGMTTLLVAVILLVASTLIIFISGRAGVQEQRISANDRRAKEAFEVAQGRLDQAIAFFKKNRNVATFNNDSANVGVKFCGAPPSSNPCSTTKDGAVSCSTAYDPNVGLGPTIVACGWSDDGAARQFLAQQIAGTPALPGTPSNPFTARGSVGVTGSFTVINYFENLTLWMGGDIDNVSATSKTFTRFPGSTTPTVSPPSANLQKAYVLAQVLDGSVQQNTTTKEYTYTSMSIPNNSNTDYLIKSTDKSAQNKYIGGDVVDKDYFLKQFANATAFFEYFFCDTTAGETMESYKTNLGENVMSPSTASSKLSSMNGQTVFVTGDFTLPNATIGSITSPVVLIVDGNLTMSSNSEFYGLIFVTGHLTGNGGPTIYGAMIVYDEGTSLTGNGAIVFDQTTLDNTRKSGAPGLVAGTWRDWAN